MSHPTDDGDDGTVLGVAVAVLEDAIGPVRGRFVHLEPRDHFAVCALTSALQSGGTDDFEAEDATLLLLTSLARRFAPHGREPHYRLGPAQRRRVQEARALLASSPSRQWSLRELGQALQCSPFHLARQFRLATGESISRYLLRLRLAVAVERLAAGEGDLAALAVAIGFAHHSHFTARFRSVFGLTPSQARQILTNRRLQTLRALVS
jgi:AraC family transcriptional regulator